MNRMETALRYLEEQRESTELRIRSGIEQNRMGEATIVFQSDVPLPEDITVEVEQTSHEFRFGANLFMLDECETAEKNEIYRQKYPELFNLATLPFYWKDLEPVQGQPRYAKDSPRVYRRPAPDLCLEYCREKGIEPKGHCLNYDFFKPTWLANATVAEHKLALEKHFAELAERYADQIPAWEVTNETFNLTFARSMLDRQGYSQFYREKDFNEWSFRTADKYFPNNWLIINDHLDFGCMRSPHGEFFGQRSPYYMEIERMQQFGVHHLDSIGFQYHCFFKPEEEAEISETRYNPRHLFDVLDTYAKLGKKIQITEMTLSAFSGAEEDEDVQGELGRMIYSIFFSHPAMEAIIYWNVVDGYAVGAVPGDMTRGENRFHGGLCRFDFSEKPIYKVLRKLIHEEWHTSKTVKAMNGTARFRGFYGDYRLVVCADGKRIPLDMTLSSRKNNQIVVNL